MLYSYRDARAITCASNTLQINSRLRHSCRPRPLKLSFALSYYWLSGSMKRIRMRACACHYCSAQAKDSLPSSHRRFRGAPCNPIAACSARIPSAAPSRGLETRSRQ